MTKWDSFCVNDHPFLPHLHFLILPSCLRHTFRTEFRFSTTCSQGCLEEKGYHQSGQFPAPVEQIWTLHGDEDALLSPKYWEQLQEVTLPDPFVLTPVWFSEWLTLTNRALMIHEQWIHGISEKENGKSIPGKGNSICTGYVADESGLTRGLKKTPVWLEAWKQG